jgi:hypothetical protein
MALLTARLETVDRGHRTADTLIQLDHDLVSFGRRQRQRSSGMVNDAPNTRAKPDASGTIVAIRKPISGPKIVGSWLI